MNRYCPVFLLESGAEIAADKYLLSATLPIELFSKKIADHINKSYIETSPEFFMQIADGYIRILAETNTENANEILHSYVYNRLHFRRTGKKRSWGSTISNPSKGLKNLTFDFGLSRRNFRAFIYAHKNHAANTRANSWRLENFEHQDFIQEIASFEYSGFDFLP